MKEKIRLVNGAEFNLPIAGIFTNKDFMKLQIVTDTTLEDVYEMFSNEENTRIIKVVDGDGVTITMYEGYVALDSEIKIDKNFLVETKSIESEGENVVEHVYGQVVFITLHKEQIEQKVEQNTADIEYLAIMSDIEL